VQGQELNQPFGGWVWTLVAVLLVSMMAMPALAQEPIKVGVLLSLSPPGSIAQGEEVSRGLEIVKDLLNARGGVVGRPLELVYQDTAGLPDRGRLGAEKLITADGVVVLTGQHQGSVVLAEIEVAHRRGVPYVNVNGWADAIRLARYPEVFNVGPWNTLVAVAIAQFIKEMNVRSVAAIVENTDHGISQSETFGRTLRLIAPNVAFAAYMVDRTTVDYIATLLPLRRNPPDMVVSMVPAPHGYRVIRQLFELGIAPSSRTWLFEGAGIADEPEFSSSVGPAAQYMLALGFYHPDMPLTDVGQAVVTEYHQRYGNSPHRLALQAADALLAIAAAIEAAGSTDREAMIEALHQVPVRGTRGVMWLARRPGLLFQQWRELPYVVYQFTEPGQPAAAATVVLGPDMPLDVNRLVRP